MHPHRGLPNRLELFALEVRQLLRQLQFQSHRQLLRHQLLRQQQLLTPVRRKQLSQPVQNAVGKRRQPDLP